MSIRFAVICSVLFACPFQLLAQQRPAVATAKLDTLRGDKMLAEYFAAETKKLQDACLADIKTLDDWKSKRGEYRRQLLEMLGLDPQPEKTDLKPVITGRLEHDDFVVEKLHFQSRPGLYVTGNLYLPKKIDKPLPTILYVCGHSRVLGKDGTPMGAKAGYQHHGAWYARNGYACLTIDTLQLGEIEGIHHGTHRYGMWWWLNRGYTPAGVEAWNCVRALDYLETRPEIDKTRFGVTGRSGGGAYSWWIAAIDDRIKVAVPTAGITDLQNHVVDGCVEGHCDCMFMVNTYRWDYPQVAALLAPRPLLISNTDSDGIFPLDGVVRTFEKVRRIYRLFDAEKRGTSADIALNISPGPHKDTQELNTHEFRWFNHYLKNDDSSIDSRAPKYFQPEQLKVFDKLPADQINTKIHETFVAKAGPPPPLESPLFLRGFPETGERAFGGWPDGSPRLSTEGDPFAGPYVNTVVRDGIRLDKYQLESQPTIDLDLYVLRSAKLGKPELNVVNVLNNETWNEFRATAGWAFEPELATLAERNKDAWESMKKMLEASPWVMTYLCPRGVGPTAFDQTEKKQVQHRRRFYLLGQTLEGMQAWDVQSAMDVTWTIDDLRNVPIWVQSHGTMAGVVLYATLLGNVRLAKRLDLYDLPRDHRHGPFFLNIDRFIEMQEVVAHVAKTTKVVIYQDDDTGWEYPQAVAKALHKPENQIQIRRKPADK